MTENNAAQPGLTDAALMDLEKQVQRDIPRFGPNVHIGVRAGVLREMLSKLRAEGVQAGEEREAFKLLEAWQAVCDRIVDQYGGVVAGVDFGALGRANRAALASAPVAGAALTSEDVERQYRDGVHIGSGLPRATCPCGFCSKHRRGFERGDDLAAPQASEAEKRLHSLVEEAISWLETGGGRADSLCADLRKALAASKQEK